MILWHKCWWANRNEVTTVITKTKQCIWHLLTCPDTVEDLSPGRLGAREPPAPKAAGEPPWTKRCHYLAEDRRKQRLIQSGTSLSCCIRIRYLQYVYQNSASPAGQSRSDSWCFWWCNLLFQSDGWYWACTWNKNNHFKHYAAYSEDSNNSEGITLTYWKRLYFASGSNLSMLIWNIFRPRLLCWPRSQRFRFFGGDFCSYFESRDTVGKLSLNTHQIAILAQRHDLHQVLKAAKNVNKYIKSASAGCGGVNGFTCGTSRKVLTSSSSAGRQPSSTLTRLFSYSSWP